MLDEYASQNHSLNNDNNRPKKKKEKPSILQKSKTPPDKHEAYILQSRATSYQRPPLLYHKSFTKHSKHVLMISVCLNTT